MSRKRVLEIDPLSESFSGAYMLVKAVKDDPVAPITPDPNEQGVIIAAGAAEQALKGKKKPGPGVKP